MSSNRILYINTKYSVGGAAIIANLLYKTVTSQGYRADYLYGRGHRFGDDPAALQDGFAQHISDKRAILTNYAYSKLFGHDITTSRQGLRILKEKIEASALVHLHNIHGYVWSPFDIIKALKGTKKIVWTIHDLWLLTGRCAFPFTCRGFQESCDRCEVKESYPKAYIHRANSYLKKKIKLLSTIWENITFVTPSEWAKETLLSSRLVRELGSPAVKVINNAVDRTIFYPRPGVEGLREKHSIPAGKKVILFVSEILNDERKGVRYVFELMERYKKREDLLFIGIGKGEAEAPNLLSTGYISDKNRLAELYSIADLFLLPTIDDNYPTTALEALSCHTPVVGFKVGGVPEIVLHGKNGFLVDKGDLQGMSDFAEKALEGCNFDFTGDHLLSLEQFTAQYTALYRSLL